MSDFTFSVGAEVDQGSLNAAAAATGRALARGIEKGSDAADELSKDLTAMFRRAESLSKKAFSVDPGRFAPLERSLGRILTLQRRIEQQQAGGTFDTSARRRAETEFRAINSLISSQTREFQSVQAEANIAARDAAAERRQIRQQELASIRRAGDQAAIAERQAGKQRIVNRQILNSQLLRLEDLLSKGIVGAARTATSAISRVYDSTIGSVRRTFSTRRSIIEGGLRNETRLFQQQSIQIQRLQAQTQRGLIGSARFGGLAAGIGGGVGITSLLSQGFTRAGEIERVQRQLDILTGNLFESRALFLQIADFSRRTPFDLTGVADLSARLLTIGLTTDQIIPNIRNLAGAVSLVGGGTDELNGIARALGQINSIGKLTQEEINQISERLPGINVIELFTRGLGFESQQAFLEAKEAGEISGRAAIDGFLSAVGADPRFAGALDAAQDSFQNLAANLRESFADIGAAVFERFETPVKRALKSTIAAFQDLASFIRGGGFANQFETLRVIVGKLALALAGIVAAKGAAEVFQLLGRGVGLLLTPMGLLATAVTAATTAFLFFFQRSARFREIVLNMRDAAFEFGRTVVENVVEKLRELGRLVTPLLRPLAAFGQRLVDIGRAFQDAVQTGGFAFGFDNLRRNLASLVQDAGVALRPLRDLVVNALGNLRDLGRSIFERIVSAVRSINFGAVVGALTSRLGSQIAGGGIGAVLGGIIAGPVGAALGAAVGVAVARFVIPALQRAFRTIDVAALFGRFLEGVRNVSRQIAIILTDRRTLTAVAGIAGAAVAIGAQIVTGLVQGIVSNLGDIVDVGALILNAMFQQNSIVKAIAAFAILFRNGISSAFTGQKVGQQAGQQIAKNIGEGAEQGLGPAAAKFAARAKTAFSNVGRVAGQGLLIALSGALSGSAIGSATNTLEAGLGAAGLASSAAAAFAIGGGQATGAALAGLTVGAGLLTAALTANSRAAQQARDRMNEYADALRNAANNGEDAAAAINSIFTGNLQDATDAEVRGLADAGFNLKRFQDELARGEGSAELEKVAAAADRAGKAFEEGATGPNAAALRRRFLDLRAAVGFLEDQITATAGAVTRLNLEGSLGTKNFDINLRGLGQRFVEFARGSERARDAMKQLNEQRQEAVEQSLRNLRDRATEIRDRATEARTKLQELITGQVQAQTPQQAGDQIILDAATVGQEIQSAIELGAGNALGGAQIRTSVDEFATQIGETLAGVLAQPGVDPVAALNETLFNTTFAIQQMDISQGAKDQLITALNTAITAAGSAPALELQAQIQAGTAEAAGLEAKTTAEAAAKAAGAIPIVSQADLFAAQSAGSAIASEANTQVANNPASVKSKADTDSASAAGREVGGAAVRAASGVDGAPAGRAIADGFRRGVQSRGALIAQAAVASAVNAVNAVKRALGIASPSRVFMGVGEDLMEGLAIGIRDGSEDVVSAAQRVAQAVVEATRTGVDRLRSAGISARQSIFQEVLLGGDAQARQAQNSIVRNLLSAFENVRESVEGEAARIWAAAIKPPEERTGSDIRVLERFDAFTVNNIANATAIEQAVDAIRALGENFLAQGQSAEQAAAAMRAYRDVLIQTAAESKINVNEAAALVNQLGLSNEQLDRFVQLANQANLVVGAAPGFAPAAAPPLTPGPNAVQQFIITNEFVTPYGDPEAVSLAVVNRLAQSVRR